MNHKTLNLYLALSRAIGGLEACAVAFDGFGYTESAKWVREEIAKFKEIQRENVPNEKTDRSTR